MSIICNFTSCGNREVNLDRIVYLSRKNFSVSFIMDGFCGKHYSNHYVDYFTNIISENIIFFDDIDSFCDFIINIINIDDGFDGKSTLSIVIYNKQQIKYLSIGDTRIYFLNRKIRTKDDSIAQKLIDRRISPESSLRTHPLRNSIDNFISKSRKHKKISFTTLETIDNEFIIICSDGFWRQCSDTDIWSMNTKEKVTNTFSTIIQKRSNDLENLSVLLLNISKNF